MTQGGARNRSGPAVDPNSLHSAKRGLKFEQLPSEGYDGEVPEFPFEAVPVYDVYFEDKKRVKEYDPDATEHRQKRELALWAWAWKTPMAKAWSKEPWRWHTVAMWVRTAVLCEGENATAADKNSLHRFADQIGMTPAGLKENGWVIARDAVSDKREEKQGAPTGRSSRDRLKAVQ